MSYFRNVGFVLLVLLIPLWVLLASSVYYHWGQESYYNFGWYVLPGFLILFYYRLRNLPEAEPAKGLKRNIQLSLWLLCAGAAVFASVFSQVNLFWRVPLIFQSLMTLIASYLLLLVLGGWPYLKHLFWAVLFLVLMVPWPFRMEVSVIQSLTELVTELTVVILKVLGYPSEYKGNIILVGGSWVGVDEACSGIRSLQALTMIAFWLGEFFRLFLRWRIVLFVGAVLLTMFFNTIRALSLTLATFHGGEETYEKFHDPVGYITFFASIFCLYFLGEKLENFQSSKELRTTPSERRVSFAKGTMAVGLSIVVFGLTLSAPIFTHLWYGRVESNAENSQWYLDIEHVSKGTIEELLIADKVKGLLGFDFGSRWGVDLPLNRRMELFYYGYDGSNKISSVSAYSHSPLVCIEGMGGNVQKEYDPLLIRVGEGVVLQLNHLKYNAMNFDSGQESTADLFWCIWERNNLGFDPAELESLDYGLQWELFMAGRRDYARQVILMVIGNAGSHQRARFLARDFLQPILLEKD